MKQKKNNHNRKNKLKSCFFKKTIKMAKYESEEGKKDSSYEPKDRKEKLEERR